MAYHEDLKNIAAKLAEVQENARKNEQYYAIELIKARDEAAKAKNDSRELTEQFGEVIDGYEATMTRTTNEVNQANRRIGQLQAALAERDAYIQGLPVGAAPALADQLNMVQDRNQDLEQQVNMYRGRCDDLEEAVAKSAGLLDRVDSAERQASSLAQRLGLGADSRNIDDETTARQLSVEPEPVEASFGTNIRDQLKMQKQHMISTLAQVKVLASDINLNEGQLRAKLQKVAEGVHVSAADMTMHFDTQAKEEIANLKDQVFREKNLRLVAEAKEGTSTKHCKKCSPTIVDLMRDVDDDLYEG